MEDPFGGMLAPEIFVEIFLPQKSGAHGISGWLDKR
jgi:hypothetical protein